MRTKQLCCFLVFKTLFETITKQDFSGKIILKTTTNGQFIINNRMLISKVPLKVWLTILIVAKSEVKDTNTKCCIILYYEIFSLTFG